MGVEVEADGDRGGLVGVVVVGRPDLLTGPDRKVWEGSARVTANFCRECAGRFCYSLASFARTFGLMVTVEQDRLSRSDDERENFLKNFGGVLHQFCSAQAPLFGYERAFVRTNGRSF